MKELFFMALVVASVSFTITTTSMFKWLRELVSSIHPKIEELIHCPYCLGHWITFTLLLITPHYIFTVFTGKNGVTIVLNFLFSSFAIMCVAGVLHFVLLRAYEPVAKYMAMRQIEKMNSDD